MKKYVLDTSVLIDDASAWKKFEKCEVIIPITVLGELDKLKKQFSETGKNARVCIRSLDEISNLGDISIGILLENNVLLKVDGNYYDLSDNKFAGFGESSYGDTQILACLYHHFLEDTDGDVILVSNDINLRIKAKARGIEAIGHEGKSSVSELPLGYKVINDNDLFNKINTDEKLNMSDLPDEVDLDINECLAIEMENEEIEGETYARRISERKIKLIKKNKVWNIFPRNKEQTFAIDLMLDKGIDLVTMAGSAGTGKSLIAIATALELVIEQKEYRKLIIYRPIQSVGNDLGFMPGELHEKLAPHFSAVMDTFEFLISKNRDWKKDLELWQKKGLVEFGALTFVRGRSLSNALIILDEAQNISKQDMKTILTRAGEGSKIVLLGDIEQIDRNDLDATNNGLIYVINKFKNKDLAGHVTFTQGERSKLATIAAEIL